MRARLIVLGAVTAATLTLTACGGDDSATDSTEAPSTEAPATDAPSTEEPAGAPAAIAIEGFAFSVTDGAAGTVAIANVDTAAHTVTADDGSFDVQVDASGSATVDIATPGTYAFHCAIHTSMTGTIVIS